MDTHPPGLFQIDGNLGAAAGMLEALVQSRWEPDHIDVDLFPALPTAWPEGEVHGLCLRGGATLDFSWSAGKLVSATLHATHNNLFILHAPGSVLQFNGSGPSTQTLRLNATAGHHYQIAGNVSATAIQ
jgi:alpha-L-fucosidase 2